MQLTRILIVDDNAVFRQCLREFLASEPDIEVVGEAADGHKAILKAREFQPDVVLMDVRMRGLNGLDATRQLKDEMPEVKVIIMTLLDVVQYREAARASGASGYVPKHKIHTELLPTVSALLAALDETDDNNDARGERR